MTETTEPTAEPPAEPPAEPTGVLHSDPLSEHETAAGYEPSETPPKTRRDPLPVLFGIGVVVLIGAVVFLWRHPLNLSSFSSQPASSSQASAEPPSPPPSAPVPTAASEPPPAPPPPPSDTAAVTPAAPPPAPAPSSAPSSAPTPSSAPAPSSTPTPSSTTVANAPPPAAPDPNPNSAPTPMPVSPGGPTADQLASLQQRLDKLEQQVDQLSHATPPTTDLAPLDKRITALENRPAPPDVAPAVAALTSQLNAVASQQTQLAAKQTSDQSATDAKIGVIGKQAADLASLSDRAARLGRIQAATAALAAGQPIGNLPDAPPALAKFSATPPPTEASVRLAFPAAAHAAETAAQPDSGKLPFWQAVQNRAENLVTVRRGDDVIVGDPTAGVIARARVALDAGDLAGAVAAVGSLTGAPAQAMAGWTSQAKALLDARAALASMAAGA